MTAKPHTERDEEKAEEARHLAEEAIEAQESGDKEEAKFLAQEAKELDREAAAEVLSHGHAAKETGPAANSEHAKSEHATLGGEKAR